MKPYGGGGGGVLRNGGQLSLRGVGPGRKCAKHHRVGFNSRNLGWIMCRRVLGF